MATELDKLIVKVQADISDLQKGLAKANSQIDGASKKMSTGFNKANDSLDKFSKTALKVGAVVGTAIGVTAVKGFVDVAVQIENLQVRLKALFGSASEGAMAFDEMAKFASKVPFSLGEIQRGSGSLAVVSDDAKHLGELLEITGNVASVTGLSFQATAEQIQRSFAGGIASADMFREKGVRQMLGFEMGTKVSIEETARRFQEVFGKGGKFGKASEELANTLTGTVSMVGDKFFNLQRKVGEGFFGQLKQNFRDFDKQLKDNQFLLEAYADVIGQALGSALQSTGDVLNALKTGLKAIFSLMVATFTVNKVFAFAIAVKKLNGVLRATEFTLKSINALTGGFFKLVAKIVVGVAIFTGLDAILDRVRENAEKLAEVNRKNSEFAEKLSEIYDLQTGGFAKNSEEMKANRKRANELAEQQKKLAQITAEVESIFQDAGKQMSDAFAESLVMGKKFGDSLKSIFKSVVAQIISTVVHIMIIKPLIENLAKRLQDIKDDMFSIGSTGFSLGDPISTGLSLGFTAGGGSGTVGTPPISGKSMGGFVAPNTPYMVGERGAELFVPQTAGNIISNRGMSGGVVINQSLNFSTGVVPTVRAEIMNLMPHIQKETISAVAEARTRGGTFARTFGA